MFKRSSIWEDRIDNDSGIISKLKNAFGGINPSSKEATAKMGNVIKL